MILMSQNARKISFVVLMGDAENPSGYKKDLLCVGLFYLPWMRFEQGPHYYVINMMIRSQCANGGC